MNHSKHQVDEYTTRFCPECNADWRGSLIPPATRHMYAGTSEYFSRLIGVEIPEVYDGVSYWACPDCRATFERTTPKL